MPSNFNITDFDKCIVKGHTFDTSSAGHESMQVSPEKRIEIGFNRAAHNLRQGIPDFLRDMSGDNNHIAVVTNHNNPDFVAGHFRLLLGSSMSCADLIKTKKIIHPRQRVPIAIAAYYFADSKPLYICHIPHKGEDHKRVRNQLKGKNEMILFTIETWEKDGVLKKGSPISYYDDEPKNLSCLKEASWAEQLQEVTPYLVTAEGENFVAKPFLTVDSTAGPEPALQSKRRGLPFGEPVSVKHAEKGDSWYIAFSTYTAAMAFISNRPNLKNAYEIKGWNDSQSLEAITGHHYFFIDDEALKTAICRLMGKTYHEDVTVIEISGGLKKTLYEEQEMKNTSKSAAKASPQPSPQASTPRVMGTPRIQTEQKHSETPSGLLGPAAFFPPSPILTDERRVDITRALEDRELKDSYERLKEIVVEDYEDCPLGKGIFLKSVKDLQVFLAFFQELGFKNVSIYEDNIGFGVVKAASLAEIKGDKYYRCYSPEELEYVFGKNHDHQKEYMIVLNPEATELYNEVNKYMVENKAPGPK